MVSFKRSKRQKDRTQPSLAYDEQGLTNIKGNTEHFIATIKRFAWKGSTGRKSFPKS